MRLLVDRADALQRAAVLHDKKLFDLALNNMTKPRQWGSVVVGRVGQFSKTLHAFFVTLNRNTEGFLKKQEGFTLPSSGQLIPVQIKADAQDDKPPSLSRDISLPGCFLIYLPHSQGVRMSRRISTERTSLDLLKTSLEHLSSKGGWIVRSSASYERAEDIQAETKALIQLNEEMEKKISAALAPAEILPAVSPALQMLMDYGSQLKSIEIDASSQEDTAQVQSWIQRFAPYLQDKLTVHKIPVQLFEQADISTALEHLIGPSVALPDGGHLHIEKTAAVTVIDVNSAGRMSALDTNLQAAEEIARQLRLRNIGGACVIDFISMKKATDRNHVLEKLCAGLAQDPAGPQVYGWTRLGLVEVARPRRGLALTEYILS